MPYPENPFPNEFSVEILTNTIKTSEQNVDISIQSKLEKTLKWLCSPPNITSFRVNTLKTKVEDIHALIEQQLHQASSEKMGNILKFWEIFPAEVILVEHNTRMPKLKRYLTEIIIDVDCGAAVLRGAHIFAPGILGIMTGVEINDNVSIYVDINKKCKKGFQKIFTDEKIFIGNGVAKMSRKNLFGQRFGQNLKPSGIAIEMSETISGCPPLSVKLFPAGFALLQNIPSIVCVHNLNPRPGDKILDMCASPGNKTTHIAALMENKGIIIALDKTPNKLKILKDTCTKFGADIVHCFQADSTIIVIKDELFEDYHNNTIEVGPPFLPLSFDKILLDAPCSALGKRPQFLNNSTETVIKSFVPLQKKLFKTAVSLLKPGGSLTYSTCTITLGENEGIVAWALNHFDCLQLVKPEIYQGGPGWPTSGLRNEDLSKVQRFGPEQDECDSVGFFIACFTKKYQ